MGAFHISVYQKNKMADLVTSNSRLVDELDIEMTSEL